MLRSKHLLLATVALMGILVACTRSTTDTVQFSGKPQLPEKPYDYRLRMPASFAGNVRNASNTTGGLVVFGNTTGIPISTFTNGFQPNTLNTAITDHGATLGRVLFYDPQLSINNSISCASCHKQELAFSDGVAHSTGFGGKVTPRNSMAILNPVFNHNMFWDSRVNSVQELVTLPIQNHIEMGMENMENLVKKLQKVPYYQPLFAKAFGGAPVNEHSIGSALTQFVCAIASANSRFDKGQQNNFVEFTPLEMMGKDLFFSTRTNCSRCHAAPNFAAPDFPGGEYGSGGTFSSAQNARGGANTGLDEVTTDRGIGDGKFRIPSLRNIALTSPYMHDGRFQTLEEVLEHYSTGVKRHPNLDNNMRRADGSPNNLQLSALEKQALLAFLHTLTDQQLLKDERFSNPFQY